MTDLGENKLPEKPKDTGVLDPPSVADTTVSPQQREAAQELTKREALADYEAKARGQKFIDEQVQKIHEGIPQLKPAEFNQLENHNNLGADKQGVLQEVATQMSNLEGFKHEGRWSKVSIVKEDHQAGVYGTEIRLSENQVADRDKAFLALATFQEVRVMKEVVSRQDGWRPFGDNGALLSNQKVDSWHNMDSEYNAGLHRAEKSRHKFEMEARAVAEYKLNQLKKLEQNERREQS